jgi:predicted RNA-binding protein with PIN domain
VRTLVVGFAADALADLPDADVPASLVAVKRFTPARRARQGATPLAAAIEHDPVFRGRVAERVRRDNPDLVAAISSVGGPPAAAPPEQTAALAYVLRLPGWEELVHAAVDESAEAASSARVEEADRAVAKLSEQLDTVRRTAQSEADHLRDQLSVARLELEEARRKLRSSGDRVRRAEAAAQEAAEQAQQARDEALASSRDAENAARRLKHRIGELEQALASAKRVSREARSVDDARLRVLLDTLMAAANGVRRELDLPVTVARPADLGGEGGGEPRFDPFSSIGGRGRPDDDPSMIDEVLTVPGVHLIIDGYNVTKRGYGSLTLHSQRARLLAGLGALAGRAPESEITVVFDATAVVARPVGVTAPRGVRVVFSKPGEIADEEIVRMVRAEPPGRPIAVVTSDREVSELCAGSGAKAVPSAALLARLER